MIIRGASLRPWPSLDVCQKESDMNSYPPFPLGFSCPQTVLQCSSKNHIFQLSFTREQKVLFIFFGFLKIHFLPIWFIASPLGVLILQRCIGLSCLTNRVWRNVWDLEGIWKTLPTYTYNHTDFNFWKYIFRSLEKLFLVEYKKTELRYVEDYFFPGCM